jgi:hypothetical protein
MVFSYHLSWLLASLDERGSPMVAKNLVTQKDNFAENNDEYKH